MANIPSTKTPDLPLITYAQLKALYGVKTDDTDAHLTPAALETGLDVIYLRLDTINDPLTGNLEINTTFPFVQMEDNDAGGVPAAIGGEFTFRSGLATAGSLFCSSGNLILRTQHGAGTIALHSGTNVVAVAIDASQKASFKGLVNLTQTSTNGDPTTTEYPADGDVGVHHNTNSGNRFWVWNDGGTIFKAQMT